MDEIDELRTTLEEQGLALQQLKQESAEAEERRAKDHSEMTEMMSQLLLKIGGSSGEVREESSGERPAPTVGASERAGASPGDVGNRDDGSVPVEVAPSRDQPGRRGPARGLGPIGEQPSNTLGGGSQGGGSRILRQKMAVPILKGRENFDSFSRQMKIYTKLQGFSSVFTSDPYLDVGNDEIDEEFFLAQGVSPAMYERQLDAWGFLAQALKSGVDEAIFHRSTSPRKCWEDIRKRTRGCTLSLTPYTPILSLPCLMSMRSRCVRRRRRTRSGRNRWTGARSWEVWKGWGTLLRED